MLCFVISIVLFFQFHTTTVLAEDNGQGTLMDMSKVIAASTTKTYKYDRKRVKFLSKRGTAIYGIVCIPRTADSADLPLVVMSHGFGGSRLSGGNFTLLMKELGKKGIASITFDYPGCGYSKERFEEYTPKNCKNDLLSSISFMKDTYSIDENNIGIVGHSMGGRIATISTQDFPYKSMALWAPALNSGLVGLADFMGGTKEVGKLYKESQVKGHAQYNRYQYSYQLSKNFFEQNRQLRPFKDLKAYRGDVFIAYGGKDTVIPKSTIEKAIKFSSNANSMEYKYYPKGNHNFGAISGDNRIQGKLIQDTVTFFYDSLID